MRVFFCLILLLSFGYNCKASDDDTLTKGISRFLAFPFFIRSPETSWGFGAATVFFFKPKNGDEALRTSDINLVGLYTLRKQLVIVLGSTIFFKEEKQIFRFQTSFSNYPDKFWGLGNDSPQDAVEDYSLQQIFFNPQLLFKIYGDLFFGASFELQQVNDFKYTAGGVFDEENVAGKNGGLASGAGMILTWDTRNTAYSPTHGTFAELSVTRFSKTFGSDFKFTTYVVDLRKFFLIGHNRVLALQTYGKINEGETPVRNLSLMGGTEIMRGYYKGRFADQNMAAVQAEIRQFLFWRLGVVAFASAGQVSDRIHNFGIGDFHYAYGFGVRIMVKESEKLNLRVDYGIGKNNSGVYVILKEAF